METSSFADCSTTSKGSCLQFDPASPIISNNILGAVVSSYPRRQFFSERNAMPPQRCQNARSPPNRGQKTISHAAPCVQCPKGCDVGHERL